MVLLLIFYRLFVLFESRVKVKRQITRDDKSENQSIEGDIDHKPPENGTSSLDNVNDLRGAIYLEELGSTSRRPV